MDGSIYLSESERKTLLQAYRYGSDTRAARRAHVVLLLAEGWSQREVQSITFASFKLIGQCQRDWRQGGIQMLLASPSAASKPYWWAKLLTWLTTCTPQDFGYFRTRW